MRILSQMEKRISKLEKFADSMKAQLGGKVTRRRRRRKQAKRKSVAKKVVSIASAPRPKKSKAKKPAAKSSGKRDLRAVEAL